jgi:hypothetical protein
MITPTTDTARPAAVTARSTVGDTSFASPTTATSATRRRTRLVAAVRAEGGAAWSSASIGTPSGLTGKK